MRTKHKASGDFGKVSHWKVLSFAYLYLRQNCRRC